MSAEIDYALNIALKNVPHSPLSLSLNCPRTENWPNLQPVCREGGSTTNASDSTSRIRD